LKYVRKHGGQELRAVVAERKLSIRGLSSETAKGGQRVSEQVLQKMLTTEPWGRDSVTEDAAKSVAKALGVGLYDLFEEKTAPTGLPVGTKLVGTVTPIGDGTFSAELEVASA